MAPQRAENSDSEEEHSDHRYEELEKRNKILLLTVRRQQKLLQYERARQNASAEKVDVDQVALRGWFEKLKKARLQSKALQWNCLYKRFEIRMKRKSKAEFKTYEMTEIELDWWAQNLMIQDDSAEIEQSHVERLRNQYAELEIKYCKALDRISDLSDQYCDLKTDNIVKHNWSHREAEKSLVSESSFEEKIIYLSSVISSHVPLNDLEKHKDYDFKQFERREYNLYGILDTQEKRLKLLRSTFGGELNNELDSAWTKWKQHEETKENWATWLFKYLEPKINEREEKTFKSKGNSKGNLDSDDDEDKRGSAQKRKRRLGDQRGRKRKKPRRKKSTTYFK